MVNQEIQKENSMKIPIIESQQSVPPGQVSIGAATAEANAIEGFGKGLMVAAGQMDQYAENKTRIKVYQQKIDEIDARNEAATSIIDAQERLLQKRVELERIPKQKEYEAQAEEAYNKVAQETIDSTKNPLVKKVLNKHFQDHYIKWTADSLSKGNQLLVESTKGSDISNFEKSINNLDPVAFKVAMDALDANIKDHVYDADTGAKLKAQYVEEFKNKTLAAAVASQKLRNIDDPAGLAMDLRSGVLDELIPDKKTRDVMLLEAEHAFKVKQAEDAQKLARQDKVES